MQQTAMRGMNLHHVQTQPPGPARGLGKGVAYMSHFRAIKRCGRILAGGKRQRRWCDRLPAIRVRGRDLRATQPGYVPLDRLPAQTFLSHYK